MSCSGCRVLRKGCSDNCMLRQCLEWIDGPQAQAHATVFVAKFFGRAGLMSFISTVPEYQRPDLFRSLLYEAVGRTVNPVNGAVGLLWTGNWEVCQSAVETVFRGRELGPLPEFLIGASAESENTCSEFYQNDVGYDTVTRTKKRPLDEVAESQPPTDDDELHLCLMTTAKPREATPSEESETTSLRSGWAGSSVEGHRSKLLRLFI